jgi:PAS domain S-box-containing protein
MRSAAPHLASFPEHNPNPIVEADVVGRVRYANPAALALFPELIEQGPTHPWLADWPAAVARMQEPAQDHTDRRIVVVGARSYHQTLRMMPEEGTVRIYGLDITNRVQAETAARQAHARTSAILESIADAFYSLDAEWRFVAVNPAAERAPFGRPASELLGRIIWEVFPKIPGTRIHQHYLDAVAKRSQEHYEAPSPLNGRWYEVFMFPRSGGLDVYLRDIDDRKKAEAALKASEERFRTLSSNAQDSIARFDGEGRYVYVNPYLAERSWAETWGPKSGRSACTKFSRLESRCVSTAAVSTDAGMTCSSCPSCETTRSRPSSPSRATSPTASKSKRLCARARPP